MGISKKLEVIKMKKILGILLVICVAITFIGIASAAEITITDVKFNIPDGYTEADSDQQDLGDGLISDSKVYINGDKNITIGVLTFGGNTQDVTPELKNPVSKVIKNKTGTYSAEEHKFFYKEGNKVILIQDPDEKFEDIIV